MCLNGWTHYVWGKDNLHILGAVVLPQLWLANLCLLTFHHTDMLPDQQHPPNWDEGSAWLRFCTELLSLICFFCILPHSFRIVGSFYLMQKLTFPLLLSPFSPFSSGIPLLSLLICFPSSAGDKIFIFYLATSWPECWVLPPLVTEKIQKNLWPTAHRAVRTSHFCSFAAFMPAHASRVSWDCVKLPELKAGLLALNCSFSVLSLWIVTEL